jgi:hypothetical protein
MWAKQVRRHTSFAHIQVSAVMVSPDRAVRRARRQLVRSLEPKIIGCLQLTNTTN